MFTGIIEDLGTISNISATRLEVTTALNEISKGDSISVNGICLTVTDFGTQGKNFRASFDYTPETAGTSTLSGFKAGGVVNLERAMKATSRFGGHMVTGHIEGIAFISSIENIENSFIFSLKIDSKLMKYIVKKGSIAIDGISLTVAEAGKDGFSVSVIPFTYHNTNLKLKKAGDKVNIETDIIAKYIENIGNYKTNTSITREFLKENGF